MTDKLVEVDRKEWIDLRDLYQQDWPKYMIGYYTLNNFISWIKQDPDIKNVHLYSLNGDCTDGTFVVIHRYQLFFNTVNPSIEKLHKLLMLIDWSHGYLVSTFLDRHSDAILKTIKEKKLVKSFDGLLCMYYLSKDRAAKLEINIPEGITLKPLDDSHAQIADDVWPLKRKGSLHLLKTLRRFNPSVGVFTKESKLIAWSFRLQAGPVGVLQVDNDCRGQGYGSLVCRAISRKIGEAGDDVYAGVFEANTRSRRMFESCGFKMVDTAHWLQINPTVPFEWKEEFD